MSEAAVFHAPPTRHLLAFAGSAVVLLIGLFLPDPFARWLCVFLGLIGVLMGAAKIALSPRRMALDNDGLSVETPFRTTRIRWRDVESLRLQRVLQNKLIIVKCRGRWQGGRPFKLAAARYVERDYFIPNIFDAPLETVLRHIDDCLLQWEQRNGAAPDTQPGTDA